MKSPRTLTLALLLVLPISAATMPARAQGSSHTKFIESVRKAFKNPTEDHELYRLVIQPEFNETVREAAKSGNDALVIELLRAYSGQTSEGVKGRTALTWAAYYSDIPLLKTLLDRKLNVNMPDAEGDTPLHYALGVGRADVVALLLEKGAQVNMPNQEGTTPLMLAAGDNHSVNTRAFLDRDAEVNAQNNKGETALMFAARNGRLDNVRLLLSEGANVNLKDKQGNTALQIAQKSPGAPYAGFHDSPGFLDAASAARLAEKAKRDQATIVQLLKRASGQ